MSKGAYCLIYHFAKKFRQSKGNSTLLSYNDHNNTSINNNVSDTLVSEQLTFQN